MKKEINNYSMNYYDAVKFRKSLRENLSFPHLLEQNDIKIYPNYMIKSIYVKKQKYPSIHIDVQRGLFYCRQIKKGGDIVKFWMVYKNLGFFDAIQDLCDFGFLISRYPKYYDSLSTGKVLKIKIPERDLYYKHFRIYAGRNIDMDEAKTLAYHKVLKRRKIIIGLTNNLKEAYNHFFDVNNSLVTKSEFAKRIKQTPTETSKILLALRKLKLIIKTEDNRYRLVADAWKSS